MAKNAKNWYDPAPALGVKYNEAEAAPAAEEKKLDVSELTSHEIDDKVESGELSAEDVYAAEKSGKARKGVLAKYAPEDENTQGTTEEA